MKSKIVDGIVTVKISLQGQEGSLLSFGKYHSSPRLNNETDIAYEKRNYCEKLHANKNDEIHLPSMMVKKSIDEAFRRSGKKIIGRRNATYTKYAESGSYPADNFPLTWEGKPILKKEVQGIELFVPSDGKKGGGSRVPKWFPVIPNWEASGTYVILSNIIDKETFLEMLEQAGWFVGLGRWRPERAGLGGRFLVTKMDWTEGGLI